MSIREKILTFSDWVMLRLVTRKYLFVGPVITYQDLPWSGIRGARRATGTHRRLQAMSEFLAARRIAPKIVLDVGCNVGYFSLSFVERGAIAYGVEVDPLALRAATIASRRVQSAGGCFVPMQYWCTRSSVARLPSSDVTICLSIWHHWVREMGLEAATSILSDLWSKTAVVLFFDTGEREMPSRYNLPFENEEPTKWLTRYLQELPDAEVTILGRFSAFAPGGNEKTADVSRTLFAVTKYTNT